MITIHHPTMRAICEHCGYPVGECSGACMAPRLADPAPTVLTASAVTRLGLQNDVLRRLRTTGCRVLCCSRLSETRLSVQIAPPPIHHRLRLAPTRIRPPEGPPRFEASMDIVRVWWLDEDAAANTAREASHAA